MEKEKIDKILDKVRKLFALAGNNPNEHEAASATERARAILTDYNLSISDIEIREIVEKEITFETLKLESYKSYIATIVADTFDCPVYLIRTKDWFNKTGKVKVVFVGNVTDVEVAFYVYSYLITTIQYLLDKKVRNNNSGQHGSTVKTDYALGISSVLKQRLMDFYGKQKEVQANQKNDYGMTGKEIMVIKQDAIQKYMDAQDLNLKTTHNKSTVKNAEAYYQGQQDGSKISLTHGINGSKETTGYIAGN